MIDFTKISPSDWIAAYAAILSTAIAFFGFAKPLYQKLQIRRERLKLQTDLYLLRKIDRTTRDIHPIVVVLLANLGAERIALKSLEYEGLTENGQRTSGGMGWYEQPEELFGIRNRLLPLVLESGQTADLPMVEIGVLIHVKDLKIWFTDFEEKRYYIVANDIAKVRRDVDKHLEERRTKATKMQIDAA